MKIPCYFFLLLLVLSSCKEEDTLQFQSVSLTESACSNCAKISINIPEAMDNSKMAKTINTALREEIIAQMIFDDTMEVENLEDAMSSFETAYADIKSIFKDEITPWEARIEGKIIFEDELLLTIQMDSYIFTGGAHGHQAKRFLNFDKKRGTELENWQLFQNRVDFQEFAEQKFRKQEAIPADASINETGLMFERDHFYLPENIGFTNKGIKLLYNPYEVASYAEGPIELTLPYKEVKPFLAISL